MPDLHETHVCRDCGAEITLPPIIDPVLLDDAIAAQKKRLERAGFGPDWPTLPDFRPQHRVAPSPDAPLDVHQPSIGYRGTSWQGDDAFIGCSCGWTPFTPRGRDTGETWTDHFRAALSDTEGTTR